MHTEKNSIFQDETFLFSHQALSIDSIPSGKSDHTKIQITMCIQVVQCMEYVEQHSTECIMVSTYNLWAY